jgi:hypothetical protein
VLNTDDWASRNLGVSNVHDLQSRKVGVHLAPGLPVGIKLVRLSDGKVDVVQPQEHPRHDGYYAEEESLLEYCRTVGLSFREADGYIVSGS